MRAREFLLEKHLSKRDFYVKSRLEDLINRLENNLPFIDEKTKRPFNFGVPDSTPGNEISNLIDELKSLLNLYTVSKKGKEEIEASQLEKLLPDTLLGKKWSEIHKDSGFGRKTTIGSVVEGLVAIAIYTKFINRQVKSIDTSDVLDTIEELKQATPVENKGRKSISISISQPNVADLVGESADSFELTLELTQLTLDKILNMNPGDAEWGRLSSAINYVNTESDVRKYNKFFSTNGVRDPIDIRVKGLQGAKTDVEVTRNGKPLRHLSMSVKAGSSRYDQASGSTEEGNIKFFDILGLTAEEAEAGMKEVDFLKVIPKDYSPKDRASLVNRNFYSVKKLYSYAANLLSTKLRGDNDALETIFIQKLFSKLINSITGKTKIIYVDFDTTGTYNKLKPELIKNLSAHINLDVTGNDSGNISFYDRDSGRTLFHARVTKQQTGRIIHVFELDSLLDMVREVQQKINKAPEKPEEKEVPPISPQQPVQQLSPGVQNQQAALNVSQQPMGPEPKQ
jgi:hypothetical protein